MEEMLTEVLIKECGNMFHDKVFIVENLPKKFLYEKTVKMVQRVIDGYRDGTKVPDPSGELVDTLYPGVEKSPTGDGGYMFWKNDRESSDRLNDIDRYIERILPRDSRLVARVPNAQQIGAINSAALAYKDIPRITLPIPDEIKTRPVPDTPAPSQAAPLEPAGRSKSKLTGDKLEKARERMRIARASFMAKKKAKEAQFAQAQ